VQYNGRDVGVVCVHAGIEPPVLVRAMKREEVQLASTDFAALRGRLIIASLDAPNRLSGLVQKIEAFEELLKRNTGECICKRWRFVRSSNSYRKLYIVVVFSLTFSALFFSFCSLLLQLLVPV